MKYIPMFTVFLYLLMSLLQEHNLNAKQGDFDFCIKSGKADNNSAKLSSEIGSLSIFI
jgi:hypothetical protein